MFELIVKTHFSAAHQVVGHKGKCQFMHGHNFKVDAFFYSQDTDQLGIAYDFSDLKKILNEHVNRLDHICLNELPEFSGSAKNNPTAENIAKYLYQKLESQLNSSTAVKVQKITVWETDNCAATYFK